MNTGMPTPKDSDWSLIDGLLAQALDLEREAREQWLQELDVQQPSAAPRVRALLGLAERGAAIDNIVRNAVCKEALLGLVQVGAGSRLGTWAVERSLGIGGMSEVYLAKRALDEGEQWAALKLISPTMARTDALARFTQETSILSQLNDARIARLIDSGRAADGRPWLAMEYVDGEPIDTGCDRRKLPVRSRVRLLIEVARAVDHAHRHLVVHRDIKPGNVLLCQNGQEIRLLDFGIAKMLEPTNPEDNSAPTRAFTLSFASPEQLAGKRVSTASDVYQLGVLLYLMLTGARPFHDAEEAPAQALLAMQEGAQRPSQRVLSGPDSHADRCGASARRLSATLAGDLDTIILKAMECEPQRRYLSARDLAEDLQHWLEGDAIRARPDSLYRIRRKLRKHWISVAASLSSLLLIIAYAIGVTWQRQELRQERARVERILDTVTSMFSESNPFRGSATPVTVDEVVESTAQQLLSETDPDPEFQVLMLERIAELKNAKRDFASKQALLSRAMEISDQHDLSAELRGRLAFAIADTEFSLGKLDESEDALHRYAPLLSQWEPFESALLSAKIQLERGELEASDRGFAALLQRMADANVSTAFRRSVHNSLGILRRRQGDVDGAVAAYRAALAATDTNRARELESRMTIGSNIAIALGVARRYRESDREFVNQLSWTEQTIKEGHPAVPTIARNYTTLLRRTRRLQTARALLERHDAMSERMGSAIDRVGFLQSYAWTNLGTGHPRDALRMALESAEKSVAEFGANSPSAQSALELIAWLLLELDARDQAVQFAQSLHYPAKGATLGRMVLILAGDFGPGTDSLAQHEAVIQADPCTAAQLSALRTALVRRRSLERLRLPDDCDGHVSILLSELGVQWTPDWAGQFEPEPFTSPLLQRLQSEPGHVDWRADMAQRERLDALLRKVRTIADGMATDGTP